jgi:salicylate 5-hydroxylase small subunit
MNLARLCLQFEVDQLNAAYAAALDEARFDAWPDFFTEDGHYMLQARENYDRKLPLALIALESKGMLQDRVYGATQTIYHGPYVMRHIISPALVCESSAATGSIIHSQANYAVFRTKPGGAGGGVSEVYQVGRYIDELLRDASGALKFKSRCCVYDSETVLNSLIYPV